MAIFFECSNMFFDMPRIHNYDSVRAKGHTQVWYPQIRKSEILENTPI